MSLTCRDGVGRVVSLHSYVSLSVHVSESYSHQFLSIDHDSYALRWMNCMIQILNQHARLIEMELEQNMKWDNEDVVCVSGPKIYVV